MPLPARVTPAPRSRKFKIMNSSSQRADGFADPRTAFAAVEFILGQFAKTLTVFFRHDFGERYFNVVDILGSSFTFLLFGGFIALLTEETQSNRVRTTADRAGIVQSNEAKILILFLLGFVAMSILHRVLAWHSKKKRPHWHSRYSGTSHLSAVLPASAHDFIQREVAPFLGISERYLVQRYIEPLVGIFAGSFVANFVNPPVGAWIIFASLSLAAVEWIDNARANNRMLDAIDAQIEARYLGEAIKGTMQTNAAATSGFVLPITPNLSAAEKQALAEGMTRLDPALEAILDTPEAQLPTNEEANADDPETIIRNLTNP